jgi:phosphoglycerate dehydrogenase-like enzyme
MGYSLLFLPPQNQATRDFALRLAADVGDASIILAEDAAQAMVHIEKADAAYGMPSAELLRRAPRLRWLQLPLAAPPPTVFTHELVEHPVVVTNMRATYTVQVATHAVALLLALARRLPAYFRHQVRHEWRPRYDEGSYLDLAEATVLLVGLGAVGREIARLLAPFGSTLIATDARETIRPEGVAELHEPSALDDLLPRADAVVVSVPHTPVTERLFCRSRFALMKRGALFVNIGRGPVVDADDLAAALADGQVRAAALDVFSEEPLPANHPLWDTPGSLMTPHVGIAGRDADPERYRVLLENARRFAAGETLVNVIDKVQRF